MTEKISKKTEKVEHELTYKQFYEKLSKLKKELDLSQVSSLQWHSSQANSFRH